MTEWSRTPEDVLIDAFRAVHEGVLDRIDHQAALSDQGDPRIEQTLTDALTQLLPLSPKRREEVSFLHAVAGLSVDNDALRTPVDDARAEVLRRVSTALEDGQLCGEVAIDLDCEDAALTVLDLVDELAAQLLDDPESARRAQVVDTLGEAVSRLCPGECHHGSDD